MDIAFTSWKVSSLYMNIAHEAGKEEYVLSFHICENQFESYMKANSESLTDRFRDFNLSSVTGNSTLRQKIMMDTHNGVNLVIFRQSRQEGLGTRYACCNAYPVPTSSN